MFHFASHERLWAQRHLTTFGAVREIASNRTAEGLLSGDFNGDGLTDLAAYGGSSIVVYYQSLPPLSWQSSMIHVDLPIRLATAARCNDDRADDIVIATDAPGEIQVFLGRQRKGMSRAWRKTIEEPFNHILVANINNDRSADLLLWGEKQLGVQVYLGNGNGTFRSSDALFGEFSYSALAVDDMNDDGIADVIAGDWISNELLLYTGFGKLRFAEPAVLHLEYEPTFVSTAYFNDDAVKDVIVVSQPNRSCQVFTGDGLGGFTPMPPVPLGMPPSGISIADVNGDGRSDIGIMSSGARCLAVGLNDGGGVIEELMKFSGGRAPSSFAFFAHGKSHKIDAAILDSASHKIRIAVSASVSDSTALGTEYLTGVGPAGIAAAPAGRTRTEDLFVGNTTSRTVSYFQQRADGSYGGQMSFSTITKPTDVAWLWRNDTTAILLASDPVDRTSSIVEIHTDDYSHRSYALPLRENSDLLSVDPEPGSGSLRIFALEHEAKRGRASLIEFEQIGPSRFIERTCTPQLPSPVSACVMPRRAGRRLKDLCYVRYNQKTKSEDLFRMTQEKPRQFSSPVLDFSVSVPESCDVLAWSGDLNGDGMDDLIVNIQEPVNALFCSLRQKDSSFAAPHVRLGSIAVDDAKELQFADVNGDRIPDILFENSLTRSIFYLPGTGNGTFLQRVRLISTEGVGGFTLRHRRRDGTPLLLITDQVQGILRLIPLAGEAD
jgi:hypothetical protein